MDAPQKLSSSELEASAATILGQILFVIGQLELNLELALCNALDLAYPDEVPDKVATGGLTTKSEALCNALACRPDWQPVLDALRPWHFRVDAFRLKRNRFVHSRWAFLDRAQQIVSVSRNSKGEREEKRYSLPELAAELAEARALADAFSRWREEHPY